jgi:pimeloyl-ACP methyl ester carboxylesterase
VATSLAARRPDLVRGLVLLDGGFVRLADLGPREEVRERLTPPRLGIPLDQLMGSIATGELAPWWTDEVRDALLPTFEVGGDGLARTRLGFDRHLHGLDGALDYDPDPDFATITCPTWLVQCLPVGAETGRDAPLTRVSAVLAQPRAVRLAGALHDVPLQWPALVAGLIRACVDEVSLPSWESGQ